MPSLPKCLVFGSSICFRIRAEFVNKINEDPKTKRSKAKMLDRKPDRTDVEDNTNHKHCCLKKYSFSEVNYRRVRFTDTMCNHGTRFKQ